MKNNTQNKSKNTTQNKSNTIKMAVAAISVVLMLIIAFTLNNQGKSTGTAVDTEIGSTKESSTGADSERSTGTSSGTSAGTTDNIAVTKDADLVIPISTITETATFYPAEIDGTKLEVLAVKAPDGTIRTAFNTCQVCYSSGRGYYVQEGDVLVCQNCGNRFGMGDVEVTKGGCNPVPVGAENKTVDNDNITISKEFLTQATVIFSNWKN